MRRLGQLFVVIIGAISFSSVAFAHVVVTPDHAQIAKELTFNISVPNEQNTPVAKIKLVIPNGITSVVPTEKPGWIISTTQDRQGNIATIEWAGSMPVGLRDDFTFSAQAPISPTELDWKAYQTYQDGTVIHWDQKPSGSDDSSGNSGPYSITRVVAPPTSKSSNDSGDSANLVIAVATAIVLASAALALAIMALVRRR